MEKELKEVFNRVEMPETCILNIENAIEEQKKCMPQKAKVHKMPRMAAAAAAIVMALVLTDGVVYAYTGSGIISRMIAFNGAVFTKTVDEDGNVTGEAELNLEEAAAPAGIGTDVYILPPTGKTLILRRKFPIRRLIPIPIRMKAR